MKRFNSIPFFLVIVVVFISYFSLSARISFKDGPKNHGTRNSFGNNAQTATQTLLNINNWSGWIEYDGRSGNNPYTEESGVVYPRSTSGVIYQDGIIWGGIVLEGSTHFPGNSDIYRVGGQTWVVGTQPGHIAVAGTPTTPPVPSDPNLAYIYRIRRDWQNLTINDPEVILDAAELNNIDASQVTPAMAQEVIDQYEWSWNNWPANFGAPYYDNNGNGMFDPPADEPGLAQADQVI